MALINCTECNKEISDKAIACIHCGCPISNISKTNLDENGVNVEEIMSLANGDKIKAIQQYNLKTGLGLKISMEIIDKEWINYNKKSESEKELIKKEAIKNLPKCPHCGNARIKKIGLTSKTISIGTLGILSNSIAKTFRCESCGFKW